MEILLPKGYSLCSQIRHGKLESKHNPIVIPPLNVEIHTVEFTLPKPKWNVCLVHHPIHRSPVHSYYLETDIFTRVLIMIDEITLPMCVVHSWTLMSLDKRLLISNMHHFHMIIISHNHFHSPNVDLNNLKIHTLSPYHSANDCLSVTLISILKIHTLNAHYSTNGVIIINYYCNLETHTLNAHPSQNNLIIIA